MWSVRWLLPGAAGLDEIKAHEFFNGIDWEVCITANASLCFLTCHVRQKLYRKEIPPPFKPVLAGIDDFRYFDAEYTRMVASGHNLEDLHTRSCWNYIARLARGAGQCRRW